MTMNAPVHGALGHAAQRLLDAADDYAAALEDAAGEGRPVMWLESTEGVSIVIIGGDEEQLRSMLALQCRPGDMDVRFVDQAGRVAPPRQ